MSDSVAARAMVSEIEAVGVLKKACSDGASIVLRLGDGEEFSSALLDVLSDGSLVLRALSSKEAMERLEGLESLSCQYFSEGVDHAFQTKFVRTVQRPTETAMVLARPRSFSRLQRRRYFRVAADVGSVAVLKIGKERRERTIIDVSGGGFALQTKVRLDQDLVVGVWLLNVDLLFPAEDVFVVSGEIRFVKPHLPDSETGMCGIEFAEMEERERERLFRHITRRERELLGRRRALRVNPGGGAVVSIPRPGGRIRVRRVINISATGALVHVEQLEEGDRDLIRGARLPGSEVRLPGEAPFKATLVVVRVQRSGDELACGVELHDLSPDDRNRLVRYARRALWGLLGNSNESR